MEEITLLDVPEYLEDSELYKQLFSFNNFSKEELLKLNKSSLEKFIVPTFSKFKDVTDFDSLENMIETCYSWCNPVTEEMYNFFDKITENMLIEIFDYLVQNSKNDIHRILIEYLVEWYPSTIFQDINYVNSFLDSYIFIDVGVINSLLKFSEQKFRKHNLFPLIIFRFYLFFRKNDTNSDKLYELSINHRNIIQYIVGENILLPNLSNILLFIDTLNTLKQKYQRLYFDPEEYFKEYFYMYPLIYSKKCMKNHFYIFKILNDTIQKIDLKMIINKKSLYDLFIETILESDFCGVDFFYKKYKYNCFTSVVQILKTNNNCITSVVELLKTCFLQIIPTDIDIFFDDSDGLNGVILRGFLLREYIKENPKILDKLNTYNWSEIEANNIIYYNFRKNKFLSDYLQCLKYYTESNILNTEYTHIKDEIEFFKIMK